MEVSGEIHAPAVPSRTKTTTYRVGSLTLLAHHFAIDLGISIILRISNEKFMLCTSDDGATHCLYLLFWPLSKPKLIVSITF
jgi:hypothetical protein